MRRLIVCGMLIFGLPLLADTVQIGKCTAEYNSSGPTFWQSLKIAWKISKWSGCGA